MPEGVEQVAARVLSGRGLQDIDSLCARWDLFFEASHGNLDPVYEVFHERCVREGTVFPRQRFVYLNKIATIVRKRAETIPSEFQFVVEESPATQAWLEGWANSPSFGRGENLWASLPGWNLWLERHGNLILTLSRIGGQVYVTWRSPRGANVFVDPEDTTRAVAWSFQWTETGETPVPEGFGTRRVTKSVREWIDTRVWQRYENGELVWENVHNLGWLPVVHVAVNGREGSPWGQSVIEELIEPQLMLAAVWSTIREVNVWAGWPAFAGSVDPTLADLSPGGYSVDPESTLRAITWPTNIASLESEQEQYLQDLYEKGRVTYKGPEALTAAGSIPSGKAILMLTQDGIQYVQGVVGVLEEKMAELLHKGAALAGKLAYNPDQRPVTVSYPPIKTDDQETVTARAQLLLMAHEKRVLTRKRTIQALLELGVLPFEESPDDLVREVEQEDAAGFAEMAAMMGTNMGGEA